ncbi:MAG: MBL fold metallo-hydrolase [Gracilibacteraceae bacterium]|jgi:competence protein ComEC|nr:MBL fold metallo-hydrolase [Gracilibacteraceae bacterium]
MTGRRRVLLCLILLLLGSGCFFAGPENGAPPGGFTVFFLDVGQADCALVLCDGRAMLIDGGNAADGEAVAAFLAARGVGRLDYIICTHAHEDHAGGLAEVLRALPADTLYCPVTEYDGAPFRRFAEAAAARGLEILTPAPGAEFPLGSALVRVLGPLKSYEDHNNDSIVLKIEYGATSFLFTGDAEREAEADILAAGYDLAGTVLKIGHHGSESSTTYPFLREIMPEHAVISCGTDNPYGHPHENTLSRLRDAEVRVWRTDMQGTITCVSDGRAVTLAAEKNAEAVTNPTGERRESGGGAGYIGNVRSRKFHLPDCGTLPAEKNRIYFATRAGAADAGYEPCGLCRP